MASPKALAAIALTLIVAMPLCLGYALASEDTTAEEWQSTNTVNVSQALLNSSSPIYTDYTDSLNNSLLIRVTGDMGAYAPSYVETSETYTSLPMYTTGTGTLTLGQLYRGNVSFGPDNRVYGIGTDVTYDLFRSTVTVNDIMRFFVRDSDNNIIYFTHTGNNRLTFFKTSDSLYTLDYEGTIYTSPVFYFTYVRPLGDDLIGGTVAYAASDYVEVDIPARSWSVNFSNVTLMLKLQQESEPIVIYTTAAQTFTKVNDVVIFNGQTYNGVTAVYMAASQNPNSFTYTYQTLSGQYANPAYGWNLSGQYTMRWTNSFKNEYVRMMVHFDGDTTTILSTQDRDYNILSGNIRFDYTDSTGYLRVNNQNFGFYSDVMVQFYKDKTVVTGLQNGWPSMGNLPQGFNSETFTASNPGAFSYIYFSVANRLNAEFRVDSAKVEAGSFPTTKDYTLSMNGIFPNESYNLKFNSIGVYGSSLTIGSNTYAVNNGRISVGIHSIPLKGAVISSLYNGSVYENYIGGHSVGTTSSPANVTFSGEWSLTATANIMEKVQVTERNWAPGQFVFDDQESFSGALILAAAAAFVGVGLYGARSGNKIGLLLIVCGGVLLIAINLI